MFYLLPTKNGIGVEVWGSYDDIRTVHSVIIKFWGQEENQNIKGYENRNSTISNFSRELRKSHEGSRLKRKTSHFSSEKINHCGCRLSWVNIIFALSALRYNMRYAETNKFDRSIFMQFEYWLQKSAIEYDEKGGIALEPFFVGVIFGGSKNIYQILVSVNTVYLRLKGGKRAFRELPNLLRTGVPFTKEFQEYDEILKQEAKRLDCETDQLGVYDEDIDFEKLKW